jgi:hypothetical protein
MRARFRGMVEKHRLRHGAAGHLLNDSPPFQILMDAGAGAEPLRTSMTLEIDGALRRRSMDGTDAGIRSVRGSSTSSTTADGRSRMNSCTSFD